MQQMALIGSGGGGCVYIGRWRGVTVAIKFIVSSNDDQLVRSQREALLSRLASHPHVVQTYATSVTQLAENMFKAKGRAKYSIHEVLRQLGAHEQQFLTMVVMGPFHRDTTSWSPRMLLRSTVRTALEIAHGMQHLHLSGLVHGDLKPGNVLLKGSNQDKRKFVAKVSDLGIAHPVGAADEMSIDDGQIGSIAYMAPEVFKGRMMKASDVYSFGVLLWQLVCGTGSSPYEGAHPMAIALGVSEGKLSLRWPPGVFRPLQQLGELCTQTDPAARPSFKSVVGALEKLERHMQRLAAASAASGATASPPTSGILASNSGPGGGR
ncbi:hypothetical protein GPECTOR_52g45 [Gonium pectorale]|uniref:Protein kinase domain-containing protein n=1 Tax=Gonium pectorale TaxID=33097 RepID=A0A150G7W8_GONPE|nr:hypothetical protein GPECTOR_52g45 [Gonium pectorale]|eukprot:KXZ45645.1 hypothetical protein GPECTOR_52g45 [Gonium pectorale]